MSKETKFLSIAIGLLQGIDRDEGKKDPVVESMNADRLYKFIQLVDESYVDKTARRTNEVDYPAKNDRNRFRFNGIIDRTAPLGNLFVETKINGHGTPAQAIPRAACWT